MFTLVDAAEMDLNLVIYNEHVGFDSDQTIRTKVEHLVKTGFKTICLSVEINGQSIAKLPAPAKVNWNGPDIKIYSRLTVKVEETIQLYHLSKHDNFKFYDILAIEPLNEKMLNYLNGGNFEFDILTFDFAETKVMNSVKKANFSLPISKGVGIEINYSDCLGSSSQRRQTIACGQMLADKTNAKGLIISSGANSAINTRSPCDVIYIGLLFGLNENQSKKAVYNNGLHVIKHSELRRNIISSVIEMIDDQQISEELKIVSKKREIEMDETKHVKKLKNASS